MARSDVLDNRLLPPWEPLQGYVLLRISGPGLYNNRVFLVWNVVSLS